MKSQVAQAASGMAMSNARMKRCDKMMGKGGDMKAVHAQCHK